MRADNLQDKSYLSDVESDAEKVGMRFVLLISLAVLLFLVTIKLEPLDIVGKDLTDHTLLACFIVWLNLLSWVGIAIGFLIRKRSRIFYFLLGVSFKTSVILLVVQQLLAGWEGFLQLQLVTLAGCLISLSLVSIIFRKYLFGK